MKNNSRILFVISVLVLSFVGCSELKNDKTAIGPTVSVHGTGFADTTKKSSANFHAKYVQAKNYDLQLCQSCHGGDYSGGTTGQSCNTCHNKPSGPENCTTCHGSSNAAPPKDLADNISPTSRSVGVHQKHLNGGILGAAVGCNECHKVPKMFSDAGHIDATIHAEVVFDSTSVFHRSNAVYSSANVSCANTYCHGNFNGGNLNVSMTWTDTSNAATQCGTCHGDITKATIEEKAFPKSGHPAIGSIKCYQCHSNTVNSSMAIIDPSKHINGKID